MPRRINDGLKKRCPCPRRQWPKCRHGWHFGFHCHGREWRYSLDKIASLRGELEPRTKADALAWADRLRGEIRSGRDPVSAPAPTLPSTDLTFGDVCDRYLAEYVGKIETSNGTRWSERYLRRRTAEQATYHINIFRQILVPAAHGRSVLLESKPFRTVATIDIKAVEAARRPYGVVGCNRLMARLRHLFNWAVAENIIDTSPFKRGHVTVVKLDHRAEKERTRRLHTGEEERLLEHASPHLRVLIVAALSTGARVAELLSLMWLQIRRDEKDQMWIILPAEKTKTREERVIPVSARLRAELEMRRTDPKGDELPPDAYVFGNETGEAVKGVKTAWTNTCRRAGIADLRFHDLRREFACRLLESSADLHDVRDFLGHANITTTLRYLKSRPGRLAKALERMEGREGARDGERPIPQDSVGNQRVSKHA